MPENINTLSTADLWERLQNDPMEFYRQVANDMQRRGVEAAPTLTRALEFASPSEQGDPLDAFERLLRQAGIRTTSDHVGGYYASPAVEFFDRGPANRMLYTEFFARNWRSVIYADRQQRAVLLSSDGIPGSWQRPYSDAMSPRLSQRVEPAIPLSELVAMTTPISGDTYRSFYLTYDAAQLRRYRVGESAEIPIADIVGGDNNIRLKKYGRALRASYEELRRMRIDKLAWFIRLAAVQAEVDKVSAAITVLISGDGNSNSVPVTWDLNGDFGGTLQTLDVNSWLWFKKKFVQPYMLTTALMTEAISLDLEQLNIGSANLLLNVNPQIPGAGSLRAINATADGIRYGWTSDVGTWQILALDARLALEQVVEIGGNISETERFITNQTQVMTMTEVMGFSILDSNAVKILDLND